MFTSPIRISDSGSWSYLVRNSDFGELLENQPALGHACQLVSWVIQAPAPPFPLFVASYFLGGFGFAMQVIPIIINLVAAA